MFIVVLMIFMGIAIGFLFRKCKMKWLSQTTTVLVWILLFLLGVEAGSNKQLISSITTLGLDALFISCAATGGSCLAAWGLWKLLNRKKDEYKE